MTQEKKFGKFNEWCLKYKPSIETIGVFAGLAILIFTAISVTISLESLKMSRQQEEDRLRPIWDFEIVTLNSYYFLKIKPYTNDIKIQNAESYFSEVFIDDFSNNWPIVSPDFLLPLSEVKDTITAKINRNLKEEPSNVFNLYLKLTEKIPFGISIEYIQYGKVKTVHGIFNLQYSYMKEGTTDGNYTINGVLFDKYVSSRKELEKKVRDSTIVLINDSTHYLY